MILNEMLIANMKTPPTQIIIIWIIISVHVILQKGKVSQYLIDQQFLLMEDM